MASTEYHDSFDTCVEP